MNGKPIHLLEWTVADRDTRATTNGEFKAKAIRYSKMTVWQLYRKIDDRWLLQPSSEHEAKAYQLHAVKREAQRLRDES